MKDAKSFYDFLSRYVDDVIYMLEGEKYVYGSHRTIKYDGLNSIVGYTQVYNVSVGRSSSVEISFYKPNKELTMYFDNGIELVFSKRDSGGHNLSLSYGLQNIDNVSSLNQSDYDFTLTIYLLQKAYKSIHVGCDFIVGNSFTDIDGIMATLKSFSNEAFSLETAHLYNMMALHNFFLNFVKDEDINGMGSIVDMATNHHVYQFKDVDYGSFGVDYIPYTLGGYKKDLFVFRYFEFDKMYFYYDVLKKEYVFEKNNRLTKSSDLDKIIKDLKFILKRIDGIASVTCDSYDNTFLDTVDDMFKLIRSVLL